jgi:hypothetical protein
MSAKAEIVPIEQPDKISPMSLLQLAVSQGADMERLSKLLELQERFEANQARKAFYAAMKLFKDNAPRITKNGKGHNDARYATLDHACAQIIPALAAVGVTHKWPMKVKDGKVTLSCVLSHELGYSDPDPPSIEAGGDTSGNKNAIQALGSSIKYLERYTLFAAVGLDDGSPDKDGAGAACTGLEEAVVIAQTEKIEEARDLVELQRVFTAAYKMADQAKDKNAAGLFVRAKDKKKRQLQQEGGAR